ARPLLEEALVLIEDQRAEAVGRESRMAYLASKQDYYGLAIDSLAALHAEEPGAGFDRRAFEMSERRRVRALLDALADALEGLGDPADSAQLMPGAVQSLDPRSLLDPQTVLLEFALGEERSFLWWVSQAGVEMFPLAGREVIEDFAQQASRLLQQSGERRARGQLELVLSQLSQLLLAPVADRLAGQRLVVVTDGALQTIPFAALPSPAADERQAELRTLLTDHEIVHLPSLSTLSLLRQRTQIRPSPPKRLAVVADPVFDRDPPTGEPLKRLAFSRQEAERILRLVPAEQTFAALGFDATKDLVTHGALADYGFLHFATHAFFDPTEPETSGVLFTQVNRSGAVLDALLRPHEIYRLRLPVEMVVLSACRSGLGREIRGEGLIGPAQGFLYAGASRVVASSWAVEDEATAELMEAFYRGILIGGLRPAAALRAAQLAMITDDQKAAPYYWAGFVLQGDWR
ncbi:MAG: CHAT domain-containing protein, partial [Acidobacteriota bacterium]